ncbi:MAG: hypothetical protein K8S99_02085 [Planctomycetes bacterium]|nr:hypothetical protein [Planctomycetota bacterium]
MADELVSIRFQNSSNRDIASHAVTYGVPIPEGVLRGELGGEVKGLAIRLENGKLRPVQTRVLETWFDGSAKWLLLNFDLPIPKNVKGHTATLVRARKPADRNVVTVEEDKSRVIVTTPKLRVAISKKSFSLFESYKVNGKEMVAKESDIFLEEPMGKRYYASNAKDLKVRIAESGPQRVVVETSGRHTAGDGAELLSFRVRYVFRPNEPGVLVSYKFTNREKPEQGIKLTQITLHVPTNVGKTSVHQVRQANHGRHWFSRFVQVPENLEIIATGAISEVAKARYGVGGEGLIVIRDLASLRENLGEYPYYLRPGNARTDMTGGLRQVYPYIAMSGSSASALAYFLEMGFNHPKSMRSDRGVIDFDIWPAYAGEVKVRRGQSKEHDLYIAFDDKPHTAEELEAIYFDHEIKDTLPIHITLDPAYVEGCKVLNLHEWLRYDETKYLLVETKLGTAGGLGDIAFGVSNKGMWDFGDFINPDRSWAHNNEDDNALNNIREYYRMRAPGRLRGALTKARHNAHVDFIAFDPDPLREGTMPAHCPEHTDGSTYPSHMWGNGLLAAYTITGNEDLRDAALSVGENMLRWQKDDPTIFYADSRECGWPGLLYCRLYEFTKDDKWLAALDEIFHHLKEKVNDDGVILYELPHGVGTMLTSYGEFVAWRALYFFYELTGREDVKEFLIGALGKVYKFRPGHMPGGWGCNDMFPCWALYKLTGDRAILEDNYPFLNFLMERKEGFPWGGNDMHFYLGELDRLGELEQFNK